MSRLTHMLTRTLLLLPSRRRARARELEEELQVNLSLALENAGPSEEARRLARRDFGNLTRAQEEARAVWIPGWDTVMQDLRFAARTLLRSPAFTLVAVLSLALGIGAATALFSLVDTITLKPLAYRDPGQLVFIREVDVPLAHIYPSLPVNMEHFRFWRSQSRSFDSLSAVNSGTSLLLDQGEPEVIGAAFVTPDLFDTLGVLPQRGRTFQPAEDQSGKNQVAMITDGLWRRRFGASPSIVGQTIRLGRGPVTVVGILPASFHFPRKDDLGPLARLAEHTEIFQPLTYQDNGWEGDYDYIVFGRLHPGLTLRQGITELDIFEKRIVEEHKLSAGIHVEAHPLQDVLGSPVRAGLAVLLSSVLMLLLIVCVNLANLLLARGSARAREFGLRIALGASRGRLISAALVETLLIAFAGAALGILGARAALEAFIRTAPVDLPRLDEVQMDARVLAFAFVLSLLCGVFFGLLPALRLSHTGPQTVLKSISHTATAGREGLRLREWLVGSEVALSTLLLFLAGLLTSSLWHVLNVDRGFTNDRALDINVSLPQRYRDPKDYSAFYDLAAARLRALPGVTAAAVASRVPLAGESNVNGVHLPGADSGALDPSTQQLVMVNVRFVGQDYFTALGIPVMRGRAIEPGDRERNVAVVSARAAAKLWPGQNPIGKIIVNSGSSVRNVEVVGVVGDVHSTRLERDPTLMVYVPFWRSPRQASDLVVRSAAGAAIGASEVRSVLQSIDPSLPAPKIRSMGDLVAESVAQRSFQTRVAGAFGIAALLLAALGIYGVVAYGVSLRRRELGIRMALGAKAGAVYRLVLWRGLRPVLLGLATGIASALAAGRLIRGLLFGVGTSDVWSLSAAALALAFVATLACLIPATSAAGINPSRVLREE